MAPVPGIARARASASRAAAVSGSVTGTEKLGTCLIQVSCQGFRIDRRITKI
jgi:hypothetical protein